MLCTVQGLGEDGKRPSEMAEMLGQAAVAAYLREKEAEAEEAAARRARNEKRRQK